YECYYLTRNGEQIYLDTKIQLMGEKGYIKHPNSAKDILREIFKPAIAAERIENGYVPIMKDLKKFFEYGEMLKQTPSGKYSFKCHYPSGSSEDMHTLISFSDVTETIRNPYYTDELEKKIMDFNL
ncbi:MAG: hypothetical protein QMD85_03665, partial [Candidatus Aenigmarchaeota archaeon]|nr:hypothetical protein [Candidatus Aenigmarchaeota archaeon]MDI6722653.1 hypothetical protein [Candidatus Aenigmarchaeota archaeon]